MEGELKEIKEQGKYKTFVNGEGQTVVIRGNIKTTYV